MGQKETIGVGPQSHEFGFDQLDHREVEPF